MDIHYNNILIRIDPFSADPPDVYIKPGGFDIVEHFRKYFDAENIYLLLIARRKYAKFEELPSSEITLDKKFVTDLEKLPEIIANMISATYFYDGKILPHYVKCMYAIVNPHPVKALNAMINEVMRQETEIMNTIYNGNVVDENSWKIFLSTIANVGYTVLHRYSESRYFVIDIDSPNTSLYLSVMNALSQYEIPYTYTISTKNGYHIYVSKEHNKQVYTSGIIKMFANYENIEFKSNIRQFPLPYMIHGGSQILIIDQNGV